MKRKSSNSFIDFLFIIHAQKIHRLFSGVKLAMNNRHFEYRGLTLNEINTIRNAGLVEGLIFP